MTWVKPASEQAQHVGPNNGINESPHASPRKSFYV